MVLVIFTLSSFYEQITQGCNKFVSLQKEIFHRVLMACADIKKKTHKCAWRLYTVNGPGKAFC